MEIQQTTSWLKNFQSKRLQNLKTRRKLWLKIHLWLGLSFGAILALIGLTGSVLVFWHELDSAINPSLYQGRLASTDRKADLNEIFNAAIQSAPAGWVSSYTDEPATSEENYLFHFYYETPSELTENAESLNVAVNRQGQVVAHRVFYHAWNPLQHSLVGFFFKLHYALFLGGTGVKIVGVIAVFLTISVLTGLILWWPLTGKWKRVLTIKSKASIERFNHDLHQTSGFYSMPVMLALLISGLYFNLPDQFRWMVDQFSTTTEEIHLPATDQQQSLQTLFSEAQRLTSNAKPQFMVLNSAQSQFTACFEEVKAMESHWLDNQCLVFDRATGQIIQITDAEHGSAGDVFLQWQWPLHSGRAFGWTGRILVFITGLICPLLFATGLIRWLQKRHAAKIRSSHSLFK